jgi:serine/tyrosine/threonine adenylyltransferase
MGSQSHVDEPHYIDASYSDDQKEEIVKQGERIIEAAGEEFKTVFLEEYKSLMQKVPPTPQLGPSFLVVCDEVNEKRLALQTLEEDDVDLFSDALEVMEQSSCDFNHFFYRLGKTPLFTLKTEAEFRTTAEHILPTDSETPKADAIQTLAQFLQTRYVPRLQREGSTNDRERAERSCRVNPKFVLRQWILEEVIRGTESERGVGVRERGVFDAVMRMALEPFREEWGGDAGEEGRFCGDVPKVERGFQCSCSS